MLQLVQIINEVRRESGRAEIDNVDSGMRLREDLDFDSLDLAVLTVKIEAASGVDVFADGLVTTVGEIELKVKQADG